MFCGKSFTAFTMYTRYCSHTCNQRHYKQVLRNKKVQDFEDERHVDMHSKGRQTSKLDDVVQQNNF